jgi:hypothetical protein
VLTGVPIYEGSDEGLMENGADELA